MLAPLLDPGLESLCKDRQADYAWDELNVQQYFYFAENGLFARLDALTSHAGMALAIGVCEWIEEWLSVFDPDPTLEHYIRAGWAALLDPAHTLYFGIDPNDWRGPVRGPMVIAIGIINEIFFESHDEPRMAYRGAYAINLARHLMGPNAPFESWLEAAICRLESLHAIAVEGAPIIDLLAPEFPKGALVAREALILAVQYHPQDAAELLRRQMGRIQADNPFFDPNAAADIQF